MLDYDLSQRGELSLYEYLYRRIREDILTGMLAADDRLPSKRALAQHLGVSLITVEGAYAQLVAEGYVRARPRSGYFVNALPGVARQAGPARSAPRRRDAEKGEPGRPALLADFSGGSADAAASGLWSRALRQALASEGEDELFGPSEPQGMPRLRAAIAVHLRQTRGMDVDPACVVVGAGAQVLDNMIVQLLGREAPYALEDPGYVRLTHLYQANGVEVRHVPLDGQGVRMDALASSGSGVVHLMPSHQFPTGRVTSIARRYELLGWASSGPSGRRRWIVEDDYDCEFRLAGRPVPALASVDAEGSVIYTNTFSKSLGAGLRLAYMVLPPSLVERYGSELGFYSSTVSSVQQVALARVLESGDYERHVARMRKRCREARDGLVAALRASSIGGHLRVEEADSGLHFVLAVESGRSEEELAARVLERGVLLPALGSYAWERANAARKDGLARFVVQYGGLDAARIPAVVAAMERALAR